MTLVARCFASHHFFRSREGWALPARLRVLVPLALFGVFVDPTVGSAGTIRVGSGAGCDAATVQAGVDLAQAQPGSDTVQISRHGTFVENVFVLGNISTDAVIPAGGFDHCTNSRADSSNI